MAQDIQTILSSSKDPNELYGAAATLINSPNRSDHETLLKFLSQESFLDRLDSEEDYQGRASFLRIGRIVKALKESRFDSLRQLLVTLTQQKGFITNWARADFLISAVVVFRPSPDEVIQFWDAHCQPEDGFMNITIQALAENGSGPAISLLEKKLIQPGFEDEEKVWWMRTAILTHRYDLPILEACRRLLSTGLPEHLRPDLVAVLFDYQPIQWHGPDNGYPPPALETAGKEARGLLVAIGEFALGNVKLSAAQKHLVTEKMTAIK